MCRNAYLAVVLLLLTAFSRPVSAQTFPFTSGQIALCDTSYFTATVSGVGNLIIPDGSNWGPYLESVLINITSNHPQTLQISLTSPTGTTVLLSAFNGAGGQNYTNTVFADWAWTNITAGSAPFTGEFAPQGDPLSTFAGENADGTWTFTVIDTACANGGTGPGGTWLPGWFTGGSASGAMTFGYSSPPQCEIDMGYVTTYLCAGETVDLVSYYMNWDQGQNVSFVYMDQNWNSVADPTAVSAPGWYTIQGWDWSGCNYYGSYEIVASPLVALGPDQVVDHCSSTDPVDLTALFPVSGVTQAWSLAGSPITTAEAMAATLPGVYQLITGNGGACSDTALVTLNITSGVQLGADGSVSICPGSSTDLTALYSTTGMTADWYFGGAAIAAPTSANTAGVYTLVATSATGCTDTAEVTLGFEASPALGADQVVNVCSNGSLDLTALYSTTGLTTFWTLDNQPVADPSAITSPGTFRLMAENAAGCSDSAFVTVNLTTPPALGQDVVDGACGSNTVDLTSSFNTAGLTTDWTLSGAAVPDPSAVSTTGLYTLVATNTGGCSDTAHVVVTISPDPVLGADQTIAACTGQAVNLNALYLTSPHSAVWTRNGTPVQNPSSVTVAGTYMLTVTSIAGCTASATVALSFVPAPVLGADQYVSICAGTLFDLTSAYTTTGLTAEWTQNGGLVTYPSAVGIPGTFQLLASNGACADTAFLVLTVDPVPVLGPDQSFSLCSWQTVDLASVFPTAGLNATYTLNGQAVADPSAVYEAGTYVVTVTNGAGCSDEAQAIITNVECLCEADFTADVHCLQEPARFTLVADSAVLAVHWDLGSAGTSTEFNPEVRFDAKGEVLVKLQATLSCGTVYVEHVIRVSDCTDSCNVWFPNSFTPDKDGVNDTWSWKGGCDPQEFEVQIFNRFGELVFATKDPFGEWDGTYAGKVSPTGVYVYRAAYLLPYQEAQKETGTITLVR